MVSDCVILHRHLGENIYIYIYMNYLKNVIIPNTPFIVMTVIDDNNI